MIVVNLEYHWSNGPASAFDVRDLLVARMLEMSVYSKHAGANTSMLLSMLEDRREISTMVKSCVAANCSNTYRDGVSLFKFPKDPALRQKWIKNVQRTRAKWSGPSEHSVSCSQHFD